MRRGQTACCGSGIERGGSGQDPDMHISLFDSGLDRSTSYGHISHSQSCNKGTRCNALGATN